jgi:RNA polymerase sigma factor (sigma-70 family)
MAHKDELATVFESHRRRLQAVAYRLLGSYAEADDAVQEAWIRLSRADPAEIANLGGWLTTVTARIALDGLRARGRRAEPMGFRLAEPEIGSFDHADPAQANLMAESVGLAMSVVLDRLTPAERAAFVLHDLFEMTFDEIGEILQRSHGAVKQLASRGRRRVRGTIVPAYTTSEQAAQVARAFLTAARGGDLAELIRLLDPDVRIRADLGHQQVITYGAQAAADEAVLFGSLAGRLDLVRVNGSIGALVERNGAPYCVLELGIAGDLILAIDIFADRKRLVTIPFPAR